MAPGESGVNRWSVPYTDASHPRRRRSDRVAGTGEVEVSRLDRWHDHRRSRTAALARADTLGTSEHLEIVEHEDRRLVPAHVLDRTRDLAILDQEGPVARQAREQDRALIHAADVPEAGTQDAALGARDHLLERGLAEIGRAHV